MAVANPADFYPILRYPSTAAPAPWRRVAHLLTWPPVWRRACEQLAIVSQKGGAGKTTLAVHLAAAAAAAAAELILDTDPQATASRWGQWRGGQGPEVIDCGAPSLLADKLHKADALGAELVVIDTPPHADAMARRAAKLADLILAPCRPRAFDLAAIETTAELVASSRTPAFVVFMAGPPRAPLIYREAGDVITGQFETSPRRRIIRPLGRRASGVGQEPADDPLDLVEGQPHLGAATATKIAVQRIVLGHGAGFRG